MSRMGAQCNFLCLHTLMFFLNRSNHLLVMINRLASFFFIWNQNWLFYHIVFQVCFQILMAASYLCLWEIDLCSIWWMQAKPYRCPNCFSCHYHDPPFFQSYNTHEYCILFQTCNLIWIWYFSDLCMNTNISDMKIKNPKPLLSIFLFSATAGKGSRGDVFWWTIVLLIHDWLYLSVWRLN